MNYVRHMLRVLKLDGTVYGDLAPTPLPMR